MLISQNQAQIGVRFEESNNSYKEFRFQLVIFGIIDKHNPQ